MSEESVIIAKFLSREEAEMAAEVLRGEGVESIVALDDAGGAYPMLDLVRGVRIRVSSDDEVRAREILANLTEGGPLAEDEDPEEGPDGAEAGPGPGDPAP